MHFCFMILFIILIIILFIILYRFNIWLDFVKLFNFHGSFYGKFTGPELKGSVALSQTGLKRVYFVF